MARRDRMEFDENPHSTINPRNDLAHIEPLLVTVPADRVAYRKPSKQEMLDALKQAPAIPIEIRVLAILAEGRQTAGMLGWQLWGEPVAMTKGYPAPENYNTKYARPAGKVLRTMEKDHLVKLGVATRQDPRWWWSLTERGCAAAERLKREQRNQKS